MGISSKAHDSPKSIVLLQWENNPQASSPRQQFWTLDCPASNQSKPGPLPVPYAVPNRLPEDSTQSNGKNVVHLPPVLSYSSSSSSISMHSLIANENVNLEISRWGPGIRLSRTQTMEKLFEGAPAGLSEVTRLSPVGMLDPNSFRDYGECGPARLIAITMNNDDGTIAIKYRPETHSRNSFAPRSIGDSYKDYEQTLRTAIKPSPSDIASWRPSTSNIPVHLVSVGHGVQYIVLVTLNQNAIKTKNLLTLNMMEERMFFSESALMKEPNQDHGFRWHTQTFELPMHVSNIAPIIVDVNHEPHLFVFYFLTGALCYARMKYTGSGSFADLATTTGCFATVTDESRPARTTRAPAYEQSISSISRWSISSRLISSSTEHTPEPAAPSAKPTFEERDNFLPLATEGCQPYAIIAKGTVWIFYQGADMDAKYVRHKISRDVGDFSQGWETVSWATSNRPKIGKEQDVRVPSHFIPVVVSGDFMQMM